MTATTRRIRTALFLAMAFSGRRAGAEDGDRTASTARDLAVEGRSAFAAGDYARARELFHRAYEMVGAPTLSVYEARSLVRLGRLVEASAQYRKTGEATLDAHAPDQFRKAVSDGARELAELAPRVPTLFVTLRGAAVGGPGVEVMIDGAPADPAALANPWPLDPGAHRVELRVDGRPEDAKAVTLLEGARSSVELAVATAPPEKDAKGPLAPTPEPVHASGHSWARTWTYVSVGVAGAGIGTGVVAGLLASSKHSDAVRECPESRCAPGSTGSHDVDAFRDLRLASTIGYAVGIAAAIGGVTLFIVTPKDGANRNTGSVEVWLDPRRAGVRGTF